MSARWPDLATWRGPTSHRYPGGMTAYHGLVVHIASGSYDGTISWQLNANAEPPTSSHFVVARDGRIAQMVEIPDASWAQAAGNRTWLSIENEGRTPGDPGYVKGLEVLTAAQIEANAKLLAYAHHVLGIPVQLASSPDGRGLGHHSMGADWGHQSCPGNPIIAQKPAIVARAIEIVSGGTDMTITEADGNTLWGHKIPNMADRTKPDVSVATALAQAWGAIDALNEQIAALPAAIAAAVVKALPPAGGVTLGSDYTVTLTGTAHATEVAP